MIVDDLQKELGDILPSLVEYNRAKEEFTSGKASQLLVNRKLEKLVTEINEFIVLLHSRATDISETEILKKIK